MNKRAFFWLFGAGAAGVLLAYAIGPAGFGWPVWNSPVGILRSQRVATGFAVGAALACSGAILQALLRNPLADPFVLGVSGGAGLGAALVIFMGWTAAGVWMLPAAAFLFGLATLALVYSLAGRGGASSLYGLLLSGVILSSLCSSLLMLLLSLAPVEGLHGITWWMLGNLQISSAALLRVGGVFIGLGLLGAFGLARDLNALTLGREMAWHVGVHAPAVVLLGLLLATLLAATAVAMAGLIGFVGLIVPHAVRAWVGSDHRRLLPASALAGGLFLVACDTLARTVMSPVELPVGVVTALLGGPFFLLLLRRRRRQGGVE